MREELERIKKLEGVNPDFLEVSEDAQFTTVKGGDVIASMDKNRSKFVTRADYNAMFGISLETPVSIIFFSSLLPLSLTFLSPLLYSSLFSLLSSFLAFLSFFILIYFIFGSFTK